MLKSNVLAHRGYWNVQEQKNSLSAIREAMIRGYGVETDIRDLAGSLVVSHDPPGQSPVLTLSDLLEQIKDVGCVARIALNIKADGLQELISQSIGHLSWDWSQCFLFDMSVPDTLVYSQFQLPFYCRASEYEPDSLLLEKATGVWVDNFSGGFDQVNVASRLLDLGKRVAFVSPELHGRKHLSTWAEIHEQGLHKSTSFEICTDLPDAAYEYFGDMT